MEIGKTLYVTHRRQWRSWLAKHHQSKDEIWLIYYTKESGKQRIPYNDAVEEALCFGWIDSITKPIDGKRWAQRFSPRRKNSALSAMNKERVRRLIKAGMMTGFGLESIRHHQGSLAVKRLTVPGDILKVLKSEPAVWKNFQKFPASYKRIRIGWIDGSRKRPEVFKTRLRYFMKMTAQNKRFGMVQ